MRADSPEHHRAIGHVGATDRHRISAKAFLKAEAVVRDASEATTFNPPYNVRVTGDLRQELAQRADAARRPC